MYSRSVCHARRRSTPSSRTGSSQPQTQRSVPVSWPQITPGALSPDLARRQAVTTPIRLAQSSAVIPSSTIRSCAKTGHLEGATGRVSGNHVRIFCPHVAGSSGSSSTCRNASSAHVPPRSLNAAHQMRAATTCSGSPPGPSPGATPWCACTPEDRQTAHGLGA